MLGRDPGCLEALCGLEDAAKPELFAKKTRYDQRLQRPKDGSKCPTLVPHPSLGLQSHCGRNTGATKTRTHALKMVLLMRTILYSGDDGKAVMTIMMMTMMMSTIVSTGCG